LSLTVTFEIGPVTLTKEEVSRGIQLPHWDPTFLCPEVHKACRELERQGCRSTWASKYPVQSRKSWTSIIRAWNCISQLTGDPSQWDRISELVEGATKKAFEQRQRDDWFLFYFGEVAEAGLVLGPVPVDAATIGVEMALLETAGAALVPLPAKNMPGLGRNPPNSVDGSVSLELQSTMSGNQQSLDLPDQLELYRNTIAQVLHLLTVGEVGKPRSIPESFLRLPEVIRRTGVCRARIYRLEGFPEPIKLGASSMWIATEVDAWIAKVIAEARMTA
jgi:prophage regulatory protein